MQRVIKENSFKKCDKDAEVSSLTLMTFGRVQEGSDSVLFKGQGIESLTMPPSENIDHTYTPTHK